MRFAAAHLDAASGIRRRHHDCSGCFDDAPHQTRSQLTPATLFSLHSLTTAYCDGACQSEHQCLRYRTEPQKYPVSPLKTHLKCTQSSCDMV